MGRAQDQSSVLSERSQAREHFALHVGGCTKGKSLLLFKDITSSLVKGME